jgi:transcriptional regulator with XRE-family HTH domain
MAILHRQNDKKYLRKDVFLSEKGGVLYLKDLHIGKIIKEIAHQKGVSSKEIAAIILRYQKNANRIYQLEDMDVEDVINISYLLKYNILNDIVKKYLPNLSFPELVIGTEPRLIKFDIQNKRVIIYDTFANCHFLKKTHIGKNIREVAIENKWNEQDMAKKLQCSQGTISNLYKSKSLKIKTLIQISNILQYHFIAKVYLSQMVIVSSLDIFDGCTITLNPLRISIKNQNAETYSVIFQQNDSKK